VAFTGCEVQKKLQQCTVLTTAASLINHQLWICVFRLKEEWTNAVKFPVLKRIKNFIANDLMVCDAEFQ
jgi:hypothetical protein